MTDAANWGAGFRGSGMDVYDELLVERMFEPWGERLLDHVEVAEGDAVLDVACGPGSVTRLAARRAGTSGLVTGCDLNEAMLAIAEAKPAVETGAPITYLECPADALVVDDGTYDVVICQQGLQFFPDRAAAVLEMRRAARPGARLGVAVWSEIEQCPPFAALGVALEEVLGHEAASGYRGGPWGFPHADLLLRAVEAVGFSDVRVVQETLPLVFEGGVEQLLHTLSAAPIGETVSALEPDRHLALVDALRRAAAHITHGDEIRSHMACNTAIAVV